jgi:biotin synthase
MDFATQPLNELLTEARRVNTARFANRIELCSIVNIKSGRCSMDCRFCAQSGRYATDSPEFPLISHDDLIRETQAIWETGVSRVGWVASGCRTTDDDVKIIANAALSVLATVDAKQICCASLGQLNRESLERLKAAGFKRYHHNLETSERFYPSICTTQRWRDRLATIERAKSVGLEICSGGLFGIGETWDDRLQLALTLQKLEVNSIPINFLNAVAGTPFQNRQPLDVEECLRIVALFRITVPNAAIRICGGRPKVFGNKLEELFQAGADALMTGNYLTTYGITPETDIQTIRSNGFEIQ